MNIIEQIELEQIRADVPEYGPGDTVRVHTRVFEGGKERIQIFEGVIISITAGSGLRSAFTVRKLSHGIGVERTFMLNSPRIARLEVVRRGSVKRAKLYYLRGKVGKATKIKERQTAR